MTSTGRVAARGQLPRTDTRCMYPTGMHGNRDWAPGGDKAHRTRAECAHQAPGCLSCWGGEGTKRRPNQVCTSVEYPKTGTARHAGPAPYRAAGSLSSVDGESTDTPVRGKPSVTGTLRVLPTQASDICLQHPSLPAARLNKQI